MFTIIQRCVNNCHMTEIKKQPLSELERFWNKVDKTDNCWEWIPSKKNRKHGAFKKKSSRKPVMAHRYSYELHYGDFDKSLFVCHKCDNPPCVRPDHLFLGTILDNNRDSLIKGRKAIYNLCKRNIIKTHCPKGHEYNEENTIIRYRKRFGKIGRTRECRMCYKIYNKNRNKIR